MTSRILILDFGSQYTQLIARRIREAKVYCEIQPFNYPLTAVKKFAPDGIILSGGPASVFDPKAPRLDPGLFSAGVPILGICYGLQLIGHHLGGKVEAASRREYGRTEIDIDRKAGDAGGLFEGIDAKKLTVWMSHGDKIVDLPPGFAEVARSANAEVVALADPRRRIYGLQFHPEVSHTDQGEAILANFIFKVCGAKPDWLMASFLRDSIERIRQAAGDDGVICATSGGVDSTVTAVMLHRAVGDKLRCFFIDNGLLRKGEAAKVSRLLGETFHVPLKTIDASARFLKRLAGVTDPEKKRKAIGNVFIEVFEEEAGKLPGVKFLAQGTLYPDVIESQSFRGPSAVIKSHHNVGGLPEKMGLKLIEPLRELFKDEVRAIGKELGLPDDLVHRQPFPGPGLAIRILGEVTPERLEILREVDDIVVGEIKQAGWYYKVWQSFAVLLPIKTVGVMGDERSYENVAALRVVSSRDGMTADWVRLPEDLLARISSRVINEVRGVNRVVYDISSKPPATIEWE